eukprot:750920-Hanusia_phi.AAC.6
MQAEADVALQAQMALRYPLVVVTSPSQAHPGRGWVEPDRATAQRILMEDGRIVSYDEAQENGAIREHDAHDAHRRSHGLSCDQAAESHGDVSREGPSTHAREERLRIMQNANTNFEDAVGEFDVEQDQEGAEDVQFQDCQTGDRNEEEGREEEEEEEVPAGRRQETGDEGFGEHIVNGARGDFNLNKENQGPFSLVGHHDGDGKHVDDGDRGRSCELGGSSNSEIRSQCQGGSLPADRGADDNDADQPDQSEEGSADANPDGEEMQARGSSLLLIADFAAEAGDNHEKNSDEDQPLALTESRMCKIQKSEYECMICLQMTSSGISLPCLHGPFCEGCLSRHNRTCPACRRKTGYDDGDCWVHLEEPNLEDIVSSSKFSIAPDPHM